MTTLIADPTLRDMFRAESLEHAQNIESGLLALERSPQSTPLLDEVFREAHSLKGAARMLGLRDIQNLAHEIENILDEARQGKIRITTQEVGPQLVRLDQIRALVAQAVGDTPAQGQESAATSTPDLSDGRPDNPREAPGVLVNAASSRQEPRDSGSAPDFSGGDGAGEAQADGDHAGADRADVEPSATTPAQSPREEQTPQTTFRIDTLRVESSRLDAVFRLSAELVVSKGRIAGWRATLDELIGQIADFNPHAENNAARLDRLREDMDKLRARANADLARLETIVGELESDIRSLRLVPVSALLDQFPRMMHDLSQESGKQIVFQVAGGATVADKRIIEELKSPMMHLLRNSLDHGIESTEERLAAGKSTIGRIDVIASQAPDAIVVTVSDDGRGIDPGAIRKQAARQRLVGEEELRQMTDDEVRALILRPGFSTSRKVTDVSGRGVGLDVVRASVERLRGTISIESAPGHGTVMRLRLPVSLTATRAVLVNEWGQTYAIPAEDIAAVRRLAPTDLHIVEGRPCFYHEGQAVTPVRLGNLLQRAAPSSMPAGDQECVLLRADSGLLALNVDSITGIEEIVIKPNAQPLARVRNVSGFAILSSGLVCVVLNPHDLQRSIALISRQSMPAAPDAAEEPDKRVPSILLVEDSITTRTQERRILEAAGYNVETAVDGADAWEKLARGAFDAVVSDINMPRMSGLELTAKIRSTQAHVNLPVVLVTSRATDADRRRGLEAGADAYIAKPEFDQTLLLDALARLL